MEKPPQIAYGVADPLPTGMLLLQGLQHILANSVGWIIIAAVMSGVSANLDIVRNMIQLSMITVGIGTILQGLPNRRIGSGYFCPPICGPVYAPLSMQAAARFGLPTLFGMTMFAGLTELLISQGIPKLRKLFPPEVVGVTLLIIGLSLLPVAIPRLLASSVTSSPFLVVSQGVHIAIGLCTLGTIVGITVWGRGSYRYYPTLIGTVIGCGLTWLAGGITTSSLTTIGSEPWFSAPSPTLMAVRFDWSLVIPFAVTALASSLKSIGDLTNCQRANDAHWVRIDLQSASRGTAAFGLTTLIGGLLGTLGHNSSSVNVGLSNAVGITSRMIAWSMGLGVVALAFVPKLASVFALLPPPVMGAALFFAAATIMVSGLQILLSRLMDTRRVMLVGLSLGFGVTVALMPEFFTSAPPLLSPILMSAIPFTALTAIVLNLVLRIGVGSTTNFDLTVGHDGYGTVADQLHRFGASVGARREVIASAIDAVSHCLDTLSMVASSPTVKAQAFFDEYTVKIDLEYDGRALDLTPQQPNHDDLLAADDGLVKMAGYLVRRRADRVSAAEIDGRSHLTLEFDH